MKFTVTITSALLAVAALANTADAACAFISPTAANSYAAGDTMQVSWADNGEDGPKCEEIQSMGIELRIGSQDQQTAVATVSDGVAGSEMGMTWVIPKQVEATDDSYFLEMHDTSDEKRTFQNFSARFKITGLEASGDGKDPKKNQRGDDDGKGDKDDEGDEGDDSSKDSDDADAADADDEDDKGKGKDKGKDEDEDKNADKDADKPEPESNPPQGDKQNGADNAGTDNPPEKPEQAGASSWFVSFGSLAIVTISVTLSNVL